MQPRPSPLTIPDRPSRYILVGELCFRLPNEKRQFQLLRFVAGRVKAGGTLQVVGSLDALAAILGACWYHPTLALEAPSPWAEADRRAFVAAATPPPLQDHDQDDEEAADAALDALEDAREAQADAARWAVLATFGEAVLDELDEEELGDRDTVGACFAALTRAMGRTFLPQEEIDDRLGFTGPPKASSD